jgi:hypothetical protein
MVAGAGEGLGAMEHDGRDSTLPDFGTLSPSYRIEAGLSQEALAERARVSLHGISVRGATGNGRDAKLWSCWLRSKGSWICRAVIGHAIQCSERRALIRIIDHPFRG